MLYFSEIYKKHVFSEDQVYIGRLVDLIFTASDQPSVTKLVVIDGQKTTLVIPIRYLLKMNAHITVRKNYHLAQLEENELYLVKNLLDKQILDIEGNKVIRVNDVLIQNKPTMYIAGIDAGYLSFFRWFGLEDIMIKILDKLKIPYHQHMLSWGDIQPLELARGRVKLKQKEGKLHRVRPEDLADHLEQTNVVNVRKILNILGDSLEAKVIGNLNINYQTALFKNFKPEKAAAVLSLIDPEEAVDILLTLSPIKRDMVVASLTPAKKTELTYLLNLSKTPTGKLVTSEYIVVKPDMTVKEIMDKIRAEAADFSHVYYIYVVNNFNQLVGLCNLHELLLQKFDTPVYKFMTQNMVVIHLSTPKEIAIAKMLKYKLTALPVINHDKQILGIVSFDDVANRISRKLLRR